MHEIDRKVNHHLSMVGFLCHAKSARLELALPHFDIDFRLWWHKRQIRKVEGQEAQ